MTPLVALPVLSQLLPDIERALSARPGAVRTETVLVVPHVHVRPRTADVLAEAIRDPEAVLAACYGAGWVISLETCATREFLARAPEFGPIVAYAVANGCGLIRVDLRETRPIPFLETFIW